MTIYKLFWGVSLILIGLIVFGAVFPYLAQLAGASLVIAGIAYLLDK